MKFPAILSALLLTAVGTASAARAVTVTKTVTSIKTQTCKPQTVFKTTTVTQKTCVSSTASAGTCKATSPIVNSGFESGSLNGWSTTSDTQSGTTLSIAAKAPGSNNNRAGTASKYAAYFNTNWTELQTQSVNSQMIQKVYLCATGEYTLTFDYQFNSAFNTPMELTVILYFEESGQTLNFLHISAQPGSEDDTLGNAIIKGVWYTPSLRLTSQGATYPHTITFTSTCFDSQASTSRSFGYCGLAVDNIILTLNSS